ncbi:MAG: PAS domain S-box protein [Acidobacteria bacterium]|nr:PAS domain S-box protein [Acidobacteriota bacterium]
MSKLPSNPDKRQPVASALKSMAETLLSSSLLEAIPDAIVAVNRGGVIVQVNSQTEDLFGYPRSELIGQRVEMLVPERQRSQHHHHRDQYAEGPKIRRMGAGLDLYGRRRDGSEFPVEISLSPVSSGSEMLVLSAIRDVSDRKRIEQELRRAHEELGQSSSRQIRDFQQRLALIVDSSQDAIIGKSLDGVITHWNQGAVRMYGYAAEEAIGKSISILAPQDRPDEIPEILKKIRHGERVEYFETVRITKDGRSLHVSISVSPIHDGEGQIVGASAIARDITMQKRTEDQLRHAQKMEAVGRLAGGVAHDFNNILGIVIACTELLYSHKDTAGDSRQYVDNIRKASDRGAALTRQLLAFSRKQTAKPHVLDLNDRLKEMTKLLHPLMGDDVQVVVQPRTPYAIVEADPGQLDQVVMNLAVNARDAMPKGGKLIIETALQEFDEVFARQHQSMVPGRYVMLSVSDNGAGMDEDTLSHIFEPFFTTKETGKGTGLGLATVYGIVKQSGGDIWVYSEPNRGTTFKIYLPNADHKIGEIPEASTEASPRRRDGTTILLVEDDALLRSLTREMLVEHGYTVLEASDGRAALQTLSSHSEPIALTLTDVVMRGMSGPELVLQLLELHPAIKIVYTSGYTGELMVEHSSAGTGIVLLEKPFTRGELLKTLDDVLG